MALARMLYILTCSITDVSLASMRLLLAEENRQEVESGRGVTHEVSPSAFLLLGMEIQGLQYVVLPTIIILSLLT